MRKCFVCSGAPKPSCYRKKHVKACEVCKNLFSGDREGCPHCNSATDKFRPTMQVKESKAPAPKFELSRLTVTAKMVYADGPDRTMTFDEAKEMTGAASMPVQETTGESAEEVVETVESAVEGVVEELETPPVNDEPVSDNSESPDDEPAPLTPAEEAVAEVVAEVVAETEPEVSSEVQTKIEDDAEAEGEVEVEVDADVDAEVDADANADADAEDNAEIADEVEADIYGEDDAVEVSDDIVPEVNEEVVPEAVEAEVDDVNVAPEVVPEVDTEDAPEVNTEIVPETDAQIVPEVVPEDVSSPQSSDEKPRLTLEIPDHKTEQANDNEIEIFPDTPEDAVFDFEKTLTSVRKERPVLAKAVPKPVQPKGLPVKRASTPTRNLTSRPATPVRGQSSHARSCSGCTVHSKSGTQALPKKPEIPRTPLSKRKSVRGPAQVKKEATEESNESIGESF